ncbi:nucleoporin NUP35-like isoform X2 [Littorina saxatilis]|uniref:Nucleoporin NUP53 n=1 Tax=Littorina saxatilis TaxID=31220 RepID=A0AAN9G7P4_9CAEN
MFSASPEMHEPMTTSPLGGGHTHLHTHGGQSQFLPGFLLGDTSSHGMSSPRLWSTSPGHKPGHPQSGRMLSRSESVKGRTGGPPVRSLLHTSATDPNLQSYGSPAQVRTPSGASRVTSPGPPTTGLVGTPMSRGDMSMSMNQSQMVPVSPSQLDPFYTQGESLRSDDVLDETWVTIFGFPPGATSFILQQFSQYGNILKHIPSAEGNWMHVHYQSKLQAKKALSKNGKVYGGRMMIGVLPCIDKSVMENKENGDVCSTPVTPHMMPIDLNSSVRSVGTPIRPLTAAYAASRSEYEVLKNRQTPKKDNSIVSKVKEYMFGW